MTTNRRLVAAAAALLDTGGEEAVTLRAVGHAAGVSHNAPYKHFKNRKALLAAVASADFEMLADAFHAIRISAAGPTAKLTAAFGVLIDYSRTHAARYHLVFGTPDLSVDDDALSHASIATLAEFVAIVEQCQKADALPQTSPKMLANLLLAAMHGLLVLEANNRLRPEKGLATVEAAMDLMTQLLSRKG